MVVCGLRLIYEDNHEPSLGRFRNAVVEDQISGYFYFYDMNGTYAQLNTADAVLSVNGQTGTVVLDADDIAPTATRLWLTSAERTKLTNLSGVNTGDQDLSGYATIASLSGYVPTSRTINGVALTSNITLDADNIAPSATRLWLTTAERTKLTNTSGTNTGDQNLAPYALISSLGPLATLATSGTPSSSNFLRGDGAWTTIGGGGDALTTSPLSQFAATTSLQLKGVISDETGSGALVFGTSPNITTPTGIVKGDVGLGNVSNLSPAGLAADSAFTGAYQPLDSDLTTIASLTATTDSFMQAKAGAWAARTIAQVKTDLGLTGTNSGDQTSIVGLTGTTAQFNTALTDGDFATLAGTESLTNKKLGSLTTNGFVKTSGSDGTLSVDTTSYQPLDSDLTTIAGLTATTDNFMVAASSAWASRTPAQARTSLGLVIGTNVQAWDADLDTWATKTAPSGTVVGTTDTQTLSGKTLTAPVISTISNTGTLTLPTSTDTLAGRATTDTLTNKRITKRVTSITSSATPTVNTDNTDAVTITALAAAITSMTTNLTGTPNNFDQLIFRIKDDGTARAITWGASFQSGAGTLLATTVISKVHTVAFIYDSVVAKWVCMYSDATGY